MKSKVKRVFCLVLAVMMVSVLGVGMLTASAVDYTIVVENAHDGETYYAYKVFDATYSNAGTSYTIEATDPWYQLLTNEGGDTYFTFTETYTGSGVYSVTTTSAVTSGAVLGTYFHSLSADTLANYGITYDGSETASGSTATIDVTNSGAGYYFITTTTGSLVSLTNATPEGKVDDKNVVPTPEKTVEENSTSTYGSSNTAEVGDTVNYKTEITNFYEATKLELVDTMTTGLKFNNDISIQMITYTDSSMTSVVSTANLVADSNGNFSSGEDYYISATSDTGFTIVFNPNGDNIDDATAYSVIVVTYSATVTADAVTVDSSTNSAYINYGNSSQSTISTTTTTTYYFNLYKVDSNGNELDGAQFELYYSDGTGPIYFIMDSSASPVTYRVATDDEIAAAGSNLTTTLTAGSIKVMGLDAGTYTLNEIASPSGYNMLGYSVYVTIASDGTVTYAYDGSSGRETDGKSVKVYNYTGQEIPSTGGIGTTIFYIVGGLLMCGAAVVLITRRRMNGSEK